MSGLMKELSIEAEDELRDKIAEALTDYGFTQDDAHLFCRPDQVEDEFMKVIDLVLYVFKALGFEDFTAQISLRDPENKEKYIGSDENWDKAEQAIINTAKAK